MECDTCAIKNLVYQYAHHLDSGDLDSVAAMFSRGKILAVDGDGNAGEIIGADAVRAHYASFTRLYEDTGTPHTMHMTTNMMVDIAAGAARASAKSYALVFQALEDFPLQPIIGVRYHDTFARSDSAGEGVGWYFETRRIELLLTGDLGRHLLRGIPGGE